MNWFSAANPDERTEDQMEFVSRMVEGFLSTIAIIATQLIPSKPKASSDGSDATDHPGFWALRREVVHKLSVKPQPFSALEPLLKLAYGSKRQAPEGVLKQVLHQVAVVKEGASAVQACKFELKHEVVDEYDPFFPHLSTNQHQKAQSRCKDIRRRCPTQQRGGTAATSVADLEHIEPFAALPRKALFEPLLLQVVMVVLHRAVAAIVRTTVGMDTATYLVSDSALHAALLLLYRGVKILKSSADVTGSSKCESRWTIQHLLTAWQECFETDSARAEAMQTQCKDISLLSVYNSLMCVGGYLHVDRIAALAGSSSSSFKAVPQSMAPEVVAVITSILNTLKELHPSCRKAFAQGQQPLKPTTDDAATPAPPAPATTADVAARRREVIDAHLDYVIAFD